MKITYFEDTDTLLLTLSDRPIVDTRDLNDTTLVELDAEGRIVSMTVEHAKTQTDVRGIQTIATSDKPRAAVRRRRP